MIPCAGGEWPVGGALHPRVGLALQGLIQRACAGRDKADAEQRVEKTALHAGDSGEHGAQIEAAPASDQNQANDLDLEELAQVVDERGRRARLRGVNMRVRDGRGEFGRIGGLGSRSHWEG
jgi:hypothetical protein